MSEDIPNIGDQVPRREAVLAFIIETITRHGTSPSFDEIGRHIGASRTRASHLVNQLIERGMLERTVGAQRSFRVVDTATSRGVVVQTLQRLGWIAADTMGVLDAVPVHGALPGVPTLATLPRVDRLPNDPDADLIAVLDKAA